MSEKLTKSERLCSERQIDSLFNKGKWGRVGPIKYCWSVSSERTGTGRGTANALSKPDATGTELLPPGRQASELSCGTPVMVLFSVPKKFFKRAWKRNLLKRRMRESYRTQKSTITRLVESTGKRIEIAFICSPMTQVQAAMNKTTELSVTATDGRSATKNAEGCGIAERIEAEENGMRLENDTAKSHKNNAFGLKSAQNRTKNSPVGTEIPDFKTIDDAVAKILEQILARC